MSSRIKTVERKIFFYRLMPLPYEDGSVPEVDVRDMLQRIGRLRFLTTSTAPASRYMASGTATVICAWPTLATGRVRLELGRIRRDDLPSLENGGAKKNLDVNDGDGLSESTHIQFFSNNIVGAEFNFYGPRAAAFCDYCHEKLPDVPQFALRPLLNRDGQKQLNELEDIRLFSIRLHAAKSALLSAVHKDLVEAFDSVEDQYGAELIEITMKAPAGRTLKSRLISAAKELFSASGDPARDFDSFSVKGVSKTTDHVEKFDLLRDKFIHVADVQRLPKHRGVITENMYSAIENAYNDLKDSLEAAPAIGIRA